MGQNDGNLNPATQPQVDYINALLNKKNVPDPDRLRVMIPTLNRVMASELIGSLLRLPWKQVQTPVAPVVKQEIPKIGEGFYALTDPLDGVLKFYRVSVPDKGIYVGMTFLAQMASDRHMPIRDRNERNRIFGLIAKNPEEAMKLYGKHIGKCGHCHRSLTDEDSRMRGIGPVCAGLVSKRFANWRKEV